MNSIDKFIADFLAACDFTDPMEVDADTELKNLPQWDSLAMLGVIVMFDTEYGKSIAGMQLNSAATVGDLFRLLDD
ncbi:MAG: acyl carrier protein [Azoarcus sp.]|jgi:acyl carrier protein|nr:acyl carrier protein [Azoarcus sp.]